MPNWHSPELLRNIPQFGDLADDNIAENTSDAPCTSCVKASSRKKQDKDREQEVPKMMKNTLLAPSENNDSGAKRTSYQQLEKQLVDQVLPPSGTALQLHVYYTDSVYHGDSHWVSYNVTSEMKLRDLFLLCRLHKESRQRDEIVLRQIDRCFLQQIYGTDTCRFSEQDLNKRIMDINWILGDGEAWLSCSTH